MVLSSPIARHITWEGFGLKLHIDEGNLPEGEDHCTLNVQATLAGQYEFPHDSYLVSAVFWLRCDSKYKVKIPVTLEMQHCGRRENFGMLKFVKAIGRKKQLPHTFKPLARGEFSSHSSYGVICIDVNSITGLAITQEGSGEREYFLQLFYLNGQHNSYSIHFVVTWCTEAHLTVSVCELHAVLNLLCYS